MNNFDSANTNSGGKWRQLVLREPQMGWEGRLPHGLRAVSV